MKSAIKVTVWGEFLHEKLTPGVAHHYPDGMHETIARFLRRSPDFAVRTASLRQPEHGLTEAILDQTDVLIWWGHLAHDEVEDAVVARIQHRVLEGMGLIVLHSGHFSKIFRSLMGTDCHLKWREATDKERVWTILPSHPIAAGVGDFFELPAEEMYGEPFGIPAPEELIFISWFTGGEVFRSGATWRRGNGRVFYFRPGHESFPTYHHPMVQRIMTNAVGWASPSVRLRNNSVKSPPLEPLPSITP